MDTNLVLRDGTETFDADETLTAVEVGPMVRPLWLHVLVPQMGSGSLDVELEFNEDGSTELENKNMKQMTAAGYFSCEFFTQHKYLLVKLNNSGTVDMGAVKVWIDPAHRYDAPYNA